MTQTQSLLFPENTESAKLNARIQKLMLESSDINQHLGWIQKICSSSYRSDSGCRVVEFGIRTGISTQAIIAARPESYTGYDLDPPPHWIVTGKQI